MAYYEAEKRLVVTDSTYTLNSEKLAHASNVILWDHDVLVPLIASENMSGYLAELSEDYFY